MALTSPVGHDDDEAWSLRPKPVEALSKEHVVSAAGGYHHSLAVTASGALYTFGQGAEGRLGHGDEKNQLLPQRVEALAGEHVVSASGGNFHSLAVSVSGEVFTFGFGEDGQLGHGDETMQMLPKKLRLCA